MGLYNGAVITSAGQNLLVQAISGTELTWTAMRVSSVAIPEGTDLTTLTALTGIEQTTDITDASVYGSNVVQASARFSNTGISEAYLMETIGIYGQVTGGSETLIAVMTAETPDEMPAYDQDSPSAFIFNVQMSVQNANSLTMVVNDTGTATVADLRRKVDLNGGDLSDTVVDTFTASIAEYPVPAAGDTMRVIGGKIVKFCADIVKTFTGASASAAGKKGLVPAPAAGRNTYYLRGDGTWQAPVNDNTTTVAGRVLDARQANPNVSGSLGAQLKSLNDSFMLYRAYTITYSPQTGVSPNNGCTLRRRGYTGVFIVNLSFNSFTNPDYVQVASAASVKLANDYAMLVPVTGGGYVFVKVTGNGSVQVAKYSASSQCSGQVLVSIPVIFDITTDD